MSSRDQQAHLKGARHAGKLLEISEKENVITTTEPSKVPSIKVKSFKEFIAEQKRIYETKKAEKIAVATQERIDALIRERQAAEVAEAAEAAEAIEAACAVSEPPPAPTPQVPRFAPGARFPSRPPDPEEIWSPVLAGEVESTGSLEDVSQMPLQTFIDSITEASPPIPFMSLPTQVPMAVVPQSWCPTCNIGMLAAEYEAHLSSWHHLTISTYMGQLQNIGQLQQTVESEPVFYASPTSNDSEWPAQMNQNGPFEMYNFGESLWANGSWADGSWVDGSWVDGVSATSPGTSSPTTDDDIWTFLFQQSHQAGVRHLQTLGEARRKSRSSNQPVKKPSSSGPSRGYTRYQSKPRVHPDGNRRIKVCDIPQVYKNATDLPAQSWSDAFIALPQGYDTLITPEEYELASDAYNARDLVYNIDTQWGAVPLDGSYLDSTQWYGPGVYDLR